MARTDNGRDSKVHDRSASAPILDGNPESTHHAVQALYELPDDKVTPEEVMALADSIEVDIQGGPAGRPLLAVPHILADDMSLLLSCI